MARRLDLRLRSGVGRGLAGLIAGSAATATAGAAGAQTSGSVSLQSDYEVRGESESDRRPVVILGLSYDHPSGAYANASGIGVLERGGSPGLLGGVVNLGYARRVAKRLSLDAGVSRTQYRRVDAARPASGYTEVYVGAFAGGLSSHVYLSPDYEHPGVTTLYGEVEGGVSPGASVRINAHAGVLTYLSAPDGVGGRGSTYDWRVSASRPFGRFSLYAALSGAGVRNEAFGVREPARTALVVGGSWSF